MLGYDLHGDKSSLFRRETPFDAPLLDPKCCRVARIIGNGGFAEVYAAYILDANGEEQRVALKIPKLEHRSSRQRRDVEKFLQTEAFSCMALRHSNLVRCLGLIRVPANFPGLGHLPEATWAMVLEYCEGGTIHSHIRQSLAQVSCPYSDVEALHWLVDVAAALTFLHNARDPIIHRDIKAENVLLKYDSEEGRMVAKVTDLGLHAPLVESRSVMLRRRTPSGLSATTFVAINPIATEASAAERDGERLGVIGSIDDDNEGKLHGSSDDDDGDASHGRSCSDGRKRGHGPRRGEKSPCGAGEGRDGDADTFLSTASGRLPYMDNRNPGPGGCKSGGGNGRGSNSSGPSNVAPAGASAAARPTATIAEAAVVSAPAAQHKRRFAPLHASPQGGPSSPQPGPDPKRRSMPHNAGRRAALNAAAPVSATVPQHTCLQSPPSSSATKNDAAPRPTAAAAKRSIVDAAQVSERPRGLASWPLHQPRSGAAPSSYADRRSHLGIGRGGLTLAAMLPVAAEARALATLGPSTPHHQHLQLYNPLYRTPSLAESLAESPCLGFLLPPFEGTGGLCSAPVNVGDATRGDGGRSGGGSGGGSGGDCGFARIDGVNTSPSDNMGGSVDWSAGLTAVNVQPPAAASGPAAAHGKSVPVPTSRDSWCSTARRTDIAIASAAFGVREHESLQPTAAAAAAAAAATAMALPLTGGTSASRPVTNGLRDGGSTGDGDIADGDGVRSLTVAYPTAKQMLHMGAPQIAVRGRGTPQLGGDIPVTPRVARMPDDIVSPRYDVKKQMYGNAVPAVETVAAAVATGRGGSVSISLVKIKEDSFVSLFSRKSQPAILSSRANSGFGRYSLAATQSGIGDGCGGGNLTERRQDHTRRSSLRHNVSDPLLRFSSGTAAAAGNSDDDGAAAASASDISKLHVVVDNPGNLGCHMRRVSSMRQLLNTPPEGLLPYNDEFHWVYDLTGQAGSFMYIDLPTMDSEPWWPCPVPHLIRVANLMTWLRFGCYVHDRPPEVFLHQPYNEKCDVFSFGVLMYELLNREVLLYSYTNTVRGARLKIATAKDFARMVASGFRPPRPSRLSAAQWSLVCRCWHHDPCERPPAEELLRELQELLDVAIQRRRRRWQQRQQRQSQAGYLPMWLHSVVKVLIKDSQESAGESTEAPEKVV
ncbi:hypothetical protein VOLCADRAFT_93738 [Volvox carteri f. nagariensis]|uniref:Protein kinase domain-containing protein n=1 Tax=Volvox carteri f. nagariensis TaxID=3068 RepID=D8U2X7_VOLCA|nr:uncharacterized protein VOLCADRAFT_93738 [Volvox carteri f. nagariensis]EFJ45977.1 hypothetical protein VOLCADRAFT_93738 [Volvox carteri f. nagariensis]|eukprot:XP_002953055.1 hypothetical protein VOLCADRAFT_93738 [Volvox carteri f. nagariensis]